jgi:hypothetical protein
MAETKEEAFLSEKSIEYQNLIEDRLLAYTRIRTIRNGLAVVSIEEVHLQDRSLRFLHRHKLKLLLEKNYYG